MAQWCVSGVYYGAGETGQFQCPVGRTLGMDDTALKLVGGGIHVLELEKTIQTCRISHRNQWSETCVVLLLVW